MIKPLLFPSPLREFPGQRWVRIGVRTWHLASMGALFGGTLQGLAMAEQPWAVGHTVLSGSVFVALELYGSCVFLLQLKGLAVVLKMVLLGGALVSTGNSVAWLLVAIMVGGVSSHMPGRYRYFSIFHGGIVKE